MIKTIRKYKHTIAGYIGMLVLQSNNIPLIVQSYAGQPVNILTPCLTVVGLCLYLYYSVIAKDVLYIIGNSLGLCLALTLLLTNL